MYNKAGSSFGQNQSNQGFSPKDNSFSERHKSGSTDWYQKGKERQFYFWGNLAFDASTHIHSRVQPWESWGPDDSENV